MSPSLRTFLSLDLPPILAASFAALSCALLGNFLLLRRQSLMGDAISHAVLPGLVGAFLLTSSRSSLPMFLGALAAGILAVALIELVRRLGRLDSGAAMGVVFSIMFALGVLLIEQAAARHVDLDADCVFSGQLETITWFLPPDSPRSWTLGALLGGGPNALPRQVTTLAAVTLIVIAFVALFFKELRITSFDPQLATALGFRSGLVSAALMALVAAGAVASFEAVGSILVIAMLICPAATARMLTDRLGAQVLLSALFALASALLGYYLGAHAPLHLGFTSGLSAAGMIATASGAFLAAAIIFSPSQGVIARELRRLRLSATIAREDLLAMLYRLEELGLTRALTTAQARAALAAGPLPARLAAHRAARHGQIESANNRLSLTPAGRAVARSLVRRHRLWETYLVRELSLRPDHVHAHAELLEHIPLLPPDLGESRDPHDKPIPPQQ